MGKTDLQEQSHVQINEYLSERLCCCLGFLFFSSRALITEQIMNPYLNRFAFVLFFNQSTVRDQSSRANEMMLKAHIIQFLHLPVTLLNSILLHSLFPVLLL